METPASPTMKTAFASRDCIVSNGNGNDHGNESSSENTAESNGNQCNGNQSTTCDTQHYLALYQNSPMSEQRSLRTSSRSPQASSHSSLTTICTGAIQTAPSTYTPATSATSSESPLLSVTRRRSDSIGRRSRHQRPTLTAMDKAKAQVQHLMKLTCGSSRFFSRIPLNLQNLAYARIALACAMLIFLPLAVLPANIDQTTDHALSVPRRIWIAWTCLVRMKCWPIAMASLVVAWMIASKQHKRHKKGTHPKKTYASCWCSSSHRTAKSSSCTYSSCSQNKSSTAFHCPLRASLILAIALTIAIAIECQLQIFCPSWIWNPFLWASYRVYRPHQLGPALQGLCLDGSDSSSDDPLCLSEQDWRVLASEGVASDSPVDVEAVRKGIRYAKNESGGLIINILARDVIDAIPPFRENVEGLVPFFTNKLSVVVYENDSSDGTRDAIKAWAAEAVDYKVDLISCGDENPDCIDGISHRYISEEAEDYFMSSAIGRMADYRQRVVDYILAKEEYKSYSHMITYDVDLGISLAPLGIIHTLGTLPDYPVASSGRQAWPGSFGSIVPPYDFSAFRPVVTDGNRLLLQAHASFCALLPEGDRWRNQCDAVSPMQLMMVLGLDWSGTKEPYQVESAYNGAAMYPIQLIRESGAKYDTGDDGQRCEHIGFHYSLNKPMYVNPKWTMNVSPQKPGGPSGTPATKTVARIVLEPRISTMIFTSSLGCMFIFVYSFMILGIYLAYPLWTALELHFRARVKGFKVEDSDLTAPLLPLTTKSIEISVPSSPSRDSFTWRRRRTT